jgi:hemoglobin
MADDRVNYFFAHINMQMQMPKLKTFLAYAFGAPLQYSGKNMREAHAHMQISDVQFGAVAGHLVETLSELGVAQHLIDEVVVIALSVKDDIVR